MSGKPVIIYLNLRRTPLEHGAALQAAHCLGYAVALIADSVPVDLPTQIVTVVKKVDTYQPEAVDRAVEAIVAEHTVAGVVTWSDRDVETVSRIAERLRLPAAPVAAARLARNKYLMREALSAYPEIIPAFARVTNEIELAKAAGEIGYPAVLKPTSASGSKGIFIVYDEAQLHAAFDELMRYTRPEADKVFTGNPNELIYEELLVGTEHSVEGFVSDGEILIVGVTDKESSQPYRLEIAHLHPSRLPTASLDNVERLTRTVVGALGLDNCAFHLECMVAADGTAKLVEVAARVGGDFITSHLIGLSTGTSFYENMIRLATGQHLVPHGPHTRHAGIRKIMAEQGGVLDGLDGLAEAEQVPGVCHLVVERQPGATVLLPPQDYATSTLGAIIAVGDSAEQVTATLRTAVDNVVPRFRTAELP